MIGYFGDDIIFEISDTKIYNFSGFKRDTASRYATHEIIGEKPVTEYIGPGLCTISFTSGTTVLAELVEMINAVKNVRSWMEGIIINRTWSGNIYFGSVLVTGKTLTLLPEPFTMDTVTGSESFGRLA